MNQNNQQNNKNNFPPPPQFTYQQNYQYPYYVPPESEVKKNANELSKKFNGTFMLVLSFIISVIFTDLILRGGYGISIPIITLLSWVIFIPFIMKDKKKTASALFSLIPIGILALCAWVFSTPNVKVITIIVLMILTKLNFAKISGISNSKFFSVKTFFSAARNVFVLPFECFGSAFKSIGSKKAKEDTSEMKNAGKALIAFLIAIPAVIVLIVLFSNIDAVFNHYVSMFLAFIKISIIDVFLDIFIGFLITLYVFPYLFGLRSGTPYETHSLTRGKGIESIYVSTFLGTCTFVYLSFVFIQINYLFSKSLGTLDINLSYSEYARRGFGELCFVVALTFIVILLAVRFTRRNKKGSLSLPLKIILTILSASSLIFVVSAVFRLERYMDAFGLTRLRVISTWLILVIAICILGLIAKIWISKMNLYVFFGTVIVLMTIGLNLIRVDSLIANYNINQYFQSTQDHSSNPDIKIIDLDTYYLNTLSSSSVPAVARLLGTRYDSQARQILGNHYYEIENKRAGSLSIEDLYAIKICRQNNIKMSEFYDYYIY